MERRPPAELNAESACQDLAAEVDLLAANGLTGSDLVREVAWRTAGIRRGPLGILDLARGGRNVISGTGFQDEFDDGSTGQVRHFAAVAAATTLLGSRLTLAALRTLLGDHKGVPDDRLSSRAIEWSGLVVSGDLEPTLAGQWIRMNVCSTRPH